MPRRCNGLDVMNPHHKRILIIKPSSLGDIVHTLPLAHTLKRCAPGGRIGWVVQKGFESLLEADPAIDELHVINIPSTSDPEAPSGVYLKSARALFREAAGLRSFCRRNPYDLTLDLHASFRSGLLGLMNKGGIKLGFSEAKELNTHFQHCLVSPDPHSLHAVDQNMRFAELLGCEPQPDDYQVFIPPQALSAVDAFLDSQMISRKRPLVYANPVAKWLTKMWPEDHWAALGDMLVTAAGVALIFGGAPGDAPLIRRIMSKMREPAYCAAGELTVIQSAALLKRSRMYVGVDSGPMHIAAFTGTPVTAIFGPTDPRKIGPYGTGHIVLRNETIDCLVCRKRACRELGCMTGVAPETVFEACVTMLERSSTPAQIKNSW